MKNVSVILNVLLAIAVVILYVLHFSCGKSDKVNSSTTQTDSISVNKDIAYVQIDSLIANYDMFHDMKVEFEKKAKQMDTEFTAKARSFQREVADFQEKAQKGLITSSQAQQLQEQLGKREEDLQQAGQKMRQELGEQEAVMMRQIQDVIMKYLAKYNEGKKYSLILNTSSATNTVLYGDKGMNITMELTKGLNEEYIQIRPNVVNQNATK